MTIYEEIRKRIACPQFGDDNYGDWGSLPFIVREEIKRLCDYCAVVDKKADEYEKIMEKRKKASEKSRASLMKNMTAEERRERAIKANKASQEKRRKK